MSSEPSERARQWIEREDLRPFDSQADHGSRAEAFDAGYSEGEKKGAADSYEAGIRVGRIFALREAREMLSAFGSLVAHEAWLDRRIREAEENANG